MSGVWKTESLSEGAKECPKAWLGVPFCATDGEGTPTSPSAWQDAVRLSPWGGESHRLLRSAEGRTVLEVECPVIKLAVLWVDSAGGGGAGKVAQTPGLGRDLLPFLHLLKATPGGEAWGERPLLLDPFPSTKAGGFSGELSLMALHSVSPSGAVFTGAHSSSWTLPKRSTFHFPIREALYGACAGKLHCETSLPVISVALADNGEGG